MDAIKRSKINEEDKSRFKTTSQIQNKSKFDDALESIDSRILTEVQSESLGLLAGSGGSCLYLARRDGGCCNLAVEILDQLIDYDFVNVRSRSQQDLPLVAAAWLINDLVKAEVLDAKEHKKCCDIVNYLVETFEDKIFINNQHDLFYGFLGNAQLVFETNDHQFIKKATDALLKGADRSDNYVFWKSPYPFDAPPNFSKFINNGIPHGQLGIVLFLLKYFWVNPAKEVEGDLNKFRGWLLKQLKLHNNKLPYSELPLLGGTGKLGWCYGDQAIGYTLLRYYETFGDERAYKKAYELIDQTAAKSVAESGVRYYAKYGFHDLRICHGLSSVAYMYFKMYQITHDKYLLELAEKWFDLTLHDLNIYLEQRDKIIEDQKKTPPSDPMDVVDTSLGFLNGLSGVGLALQTYLNPKLSFWDKILLLDRPGRE